MCKPLFSCHFYQNIKMAPRNYRPDYLNWHWLFLTSHIQVLEIWNEEWWIHSIVLVQDKSRRIHEKGIFDDDFRLGCTEMYWMTPKQNGCLKLLWIYFSRKINANYILLFLNTNHTFINEENKKLLHLWII